MQANLTRREFLIAASLLASCGSSVEQISRSHSEARLLSRPHAVATMPTPGTTTLELASGRDGLLYIPASAKAAAPLLIMLHGATGSGARVLTRVQPIADDLGVIILAPDSRAGTWDVTTGQVGADVAFIDSALRQTFERVPVDPRRISIAGFSDGASYALTLGLSNGDLFDGLAAFSPGFLRVPTSPIGTPRIFLSHGTRDEILPIDQCSRPISRTLTRAGYNVHYREFDGPHAAPPEVMREGLNWLFKPGR
jgi:phospholipase/carboxylesterase